MDWSGHWHGYGPWIGTRDEYSKEYLRIPGASPDDEQTRTFLANRIPPVMTGHALLRVAQTSPDRTWINASSAIDWLKKTYADHPPLGDYLPLEARVRYDEEFLPLGMDVIWAYYKRSTELISYSVICCPHRGFPDIPCPLPPS